MKTFIACLGTETNTFSPMPTGLATFEETMLYRGDATRRPADAFSLPLHVWRRASEERQGTVTESLAAFAQPAGLTVRGVYEALRDEILADLRAALPVDIVLLSMHGAMTAEGYPDCEGDLLARVRGIVGPDTVVGAELDLHCSITGAMVDNRRCPRALQGVPAHGCRRSRGGAVRPLRAQAPRGDRPGHGVVYQFDST